jgi:hypothetical protein
LTQLAHALLPLGNAIRCLLAALVRTETEAVLASLGGRPDRGRADDRAEARAERGLGRLDEQLRVLRDRVDQLERQLRERAGGAGASPVTRASASRPVRKGTTTAKTAARTGTTRTSAATGKTTARKTTAKKATARRATAGKATAKKATAKKATPRRTTAAKAVARTSAGRTSPRSPRRTGAGS